MIRNSLVSIALFQHPHNIMSLDVLLAKSILNKKQVLVYCRKLNMSSCIYLLRSYMYSFERLIVLKILMINYETKNLLHLINFS